MKVNNSLPGISFEFGKGSTKKESLSESLANIDNPEYDKALFRLVDNVLLELYEECYSSNKTEILVAPSSLDHIKNPKTMNLKSDVKQKPSSSKSTDKTLSKEKKVYRRVVKNKTESSANNPMPNKSPLRNEEIQKMEGNTKKLKLNYSPAGNDLLLKLNIEKKERFVKMKELNEKKVNKLEYEILDLLKEKEFLENELLKEKREMISERLKSNKFTHNERILIFRNRTPIKKQANEKLPPLSKTKSVY